MKQFFSIVFGGLAAILVGVGIASAGRLAWRTWVSGHPQTLSAFHVDANPEALPEAAGTDSTSISNDARTVRYSADEEENLIDAATSALPAGADGKITAGGYLVKDLTTGEVVASHRSDTLMPIASLTKLVTAVVARRLIDPDEKITITRAIMATYGNTAGFRAGETFTASDLMYPLLMVSSNDAAEAYAIHYGRPKFIQAMNDFAQSIGAYRTYFDDASGLSPNNVSTANDLALILNWIRTNDPAIIQLTLVKSKIVRAHTWVNPTHFLSWSYYLGGKNGYTTEANRTATALFALGFAKHPYAVIVLGSDNRDADMLRLIAKVK